MISAGQRILSSDILVEHNSDGTHKTLTINGSQIVVGSISADKINVTQLSAISANLGTVTAGTITGGTIQTATSGARLVVDSTGLKSYDSGGIQRVEILNDGSGWLGSSIAFAWTAGGVLGINGAFINVGSISADQLNVTELSAITANLGTITAGTITGGTLQTATSGARVVINSTGLKSYDATTQRSQILNDGSGWLGSSTGFAWTSAGVITMNLGGGSIVTSSSNPKMAIDSTGIKAYDAGGVQRVQILNDGSGWLGSSSVLSWTTAGVVTLNGSAVLPGTITDGALNLSNIPAISNLTLTNNSPSAGYVAWSAFTLTFGGTQYSISSGNTNNKYIYWTKPNTTLTTSATAPAMAANQFMVIYNNGGTGIVSIFLNFIYADFISVTQLSALSANMGSITAGTITGGTIRTAASPSARIEMNTSFLAGYSDATTKQFYLDASNGKAYAGGGNSILDANGFAVVQGASQARSQSFSFLNGSNVESDIHGITSISAHEIDVVAYSVASKSSLVKLEADSPSTFDAQVRLQALAGASLQSGVLDIIANTSSNSYAALFATAGTFAGLRIGSSGTPSAMLDVRGSSAFNGNMVFTTDNTYDIGASGATRPRRLYLSDGIYTALGQKWDFGGYTAGSPPPTTGYLTVKINGTTYNIAV